MVISKHGLQATEAECCQGHTLVDIFRQHFLALTTLVNVTLLSLAQKDIITLMSSSTGSGVHV